MALVLRFDENHDFINTIIAETVSECGNCLALCFTAHDEKIKFNNALLIKNGRVIQNFYESNLPHKIKTFLLLGGLENAIANYTGNNNN